MLRATAVGGSAGRRVGVIASSARLPRYLASQTSIRALSTNGSLLSRPPSLRVQSYALPGTSRHLSLWSSKPPAPPETPPVAPAPEAPATEELTATIPEVPEVPASELASTVDATSVSDILANASPDAVNAMLPMQYGDLASLGLASYWPAGLCQWGMEALHVSTGLPWFWTIVGATVASRLLVFPFAVKGMRNAAKMAPHQQEIQELTAQLKKAYEKRDQLEQQRVALKQKAMYQRLGINPLASMLPVFIQLPVTLGMFFGVKAMCELPVAQLKWSGVSFLPDLTMVDPTYILPVLSVIAINWQIVVSGWDMASSSVAPYILTAFRALSIPSFFIFAMWPAGLQLTVLMNVVCLVLQSLILRVPALRRAVGLPINPPGIGIKPASIKETTEAIQSWWKQTKAQAMTAKPPPKSAPSVMIHKKR